MNPPKSLRAATLRQRKKVLQVSGRLFWENGYLGTSIDDIASAAHVNKASIYYYFHNKSDILFELAMFFITSFIEVVQPIVESDLPPARKMEEFVKKHLIYSLDRLGFSGIGQRERGNLPARMKREYTSMRDNYEELFRRILEEGVAQGEFHVRDPKLTSKFCLGLLNSTALWFKEKGKYSPEKIAREECSFILGALKKGDRVVSDKIRVLEPEKT
jgi:AcrR family transcriptional regulator